MKKISFLALFIFSANVWSCPQINGTFNCARPGFNNEYTDTIRTVNSNGITSYITIVNGEEFTFPVDGTEYSYEMGDIVTGKTRTTCFKNGVLTEVIGTVIPSQNNNGGPFYSKVVHKITSESSFSITREIIYGSQAKRTTLYHCQSIQLPLPFQIPDSDS